MKYPIEDIEGIGPANAEKLARASIADTDDLLEQCATPAGRRAVCAATRVSESTLLKWANIADMMRINGIGSEYSELLEAAGVDTIKELKHRNPENLAAKLVEVNGRRRLTRVTPSVKVVDNWICQAATLKPRIRH